MENAKQTNGWKKVLMIVGGITIGAVGLVVAILFIVSATSKKLDCKSEYGDITIMYNDDTVTGYMANGISYDLDQQKAYAGQVGIEDYLDEFSDWFSTNTDGICTKR